jgi:hypothetical protein
MDKDWPDRFKASEQKSRSGSIPWRLLDMLGYFGLAVYLMIVAVDYFKKARTTLS